MFLWCKKSPKHQVSKTSITLASRTILFCTGKKMDLDATHSCSRAAKPNSGLIWLHKCSLTVWQPFVEAGSVSTEWHFSMESGQVWQPEYWNKRYNIHTSLHFKPSTMASRGDAKLTHCMHSYCNTVATPPPLFFSFMPFIDTKTLLSWYQGWAEFINVCNPRVSEGITALLHILPSYGGPPALQRRNITLHLQFKIKTDECIKKIFQFYSKPSIYFCFLNPCSKFLLWSVQCVFSFFFYHFPRLFQQVYWFSKQMLGRYGVFKKKKKVLLIIQMTTLNHTAISVFIAWIGILPSAPAEVTK